MLHWKTTPCMLKTTTWCNRGKIFLSIPYPHFITICLVWQHHNVLQTSVTASKRFRIGPASCILLQLFEATCVRNVLIVKNLEHEKFKELCHMKEERLFHLFFTFWKLCYIYFDRTKPCCKLLWQTTQNQKVANYFFDDVDVLGPTA